MSWQAAVIFFIYKYYYYEKKSISRHVFDCIKQYYCNFFPIYFCFSRNVADALIDISVSVKWLVKKSDERKCVLSIKWNFDIR